MGKSEKKSKEKKHHKDKSHRKGDRKKSKHRSKYSHSKSEERPDPEDSLSIMLTHGLLAFPDLQEDIPAMLVAMDSGECINIAAISNPERREFLETLFSHPSMPAELHPGSGWAKAEGCACIRRTVLNTFVNNGDVINPQELSQSQARAARIAPVVQTMLRKIPDLIGELGTLFTMICDGEAVDLAGMDNKEVKKALSQCLRDIGVDQPEDGGKYSFCLPEFEEEIMREALQHHAKVLSALNEFKKKEAKRKESQTLQKDESVTKEVENESESDRSGASSDSEHSGSDDEGSDTSSAGPQPAGPGLKGPARPTTEQIKAAQAAAAKMIENDSDSDTSLRDVEESVAVGPLPPPSGMTPGNASAANVPALYDALGAEGFDIPKLSTADVTEEPTDNTSGREEWMLTPGQNRPSGGIDQLFKSGKNRFEGGKEAKKAAAALKAEREAVEKLMEDPEEKKRTEAILAEYREKRGPSLMDAHLEKVGKKPKLVNTRMKSFDHEKEMGGHRKMNIKDVQGMVQQSKELDTRFDKASVQKNFL